MPVRIARSRFLQAEIADPPFATSVDASDRYLLDQYSNPYLMRGCSPWLMMTYLSTTQMETFFALRQGHGFNTAIVTLFPPLVFQGRNGDTVDDVYPFTGQPTTIDVTTPNETYWARVDTMFSLAEQYGFTIVATAADWWGWADDVGNNTAFSDQGTAGWEDYGEFIGTRYGSRPNVIWLLGHDYEFDKWAANNQWFTAILTGLANVGATGNLVTLHNLRDPSRDNTDLVSVIDFDLTYNYVSMSAQVLQEYGLSSPVMPVIHSESQYEGENNDGWLPANADDRCVRIQLLWTLSCGAMGSFIGHTAEWKFESGWETSIDSVAAAQVKQIFDWWETLPWQTLIPDSGADLLTAGRGTFDNAPFTSSYAGVMRDTTGATPATLAVLFVPTARTVTIDETKIAGTLTATWRDPSSGDEQAALGELGDYTTPGNNDAGDPDWLLVLEGSG